jgi:hypothetical protein
MIAPLPVQQEELVIVQIVDGKADLTVVHRPAHRRRSHLPLGRPYERIPRVSKQRYVYALHPRAASSEDTE